ncbi:MAG: cytochrome c [Pseudomonadota bacterium]
MPALALLVALFAACATALAQAPQPARRAALDELVRQDCGSCHGLTMKGGLGPALDPQSLAGKDPEQMRHVILQGRRGTAMPPWREHLSEAEAGWIVEQLRRGLPK